ncbi:clarin-3 [Xiphias gladius]|uniref:clarin-3 n=1 Tax=Xiphias gladius TaxID=8245 RepID=UPI001A986EF6|nr:clarin-3 [Xiphias gladius]
MPSTTKTLHFMSSALVTAVSLGLLGYSMSTQWAKTTMECARRGSGFFNGTATITFELFGGNLNRAFCPLFGGTDDFQVISKLMETGVTPVALYILVLCLLALCLLFSAGSILISLYNSVSNPYETYMGPVGVYTCSSLSACLSVAVLIIFAVNVNVTNMAEDLVNNFSEAIPVDLRNKSSEMQLGYYLVIPYTLLSLFGIVLIYMYDHAAYKHRREQQRPTEDAPKEVMMY